MVNDPGPSFAPRNTRSAATGADRFEALYAANHRAILAYCMRRIGRVDAYDAAAEVFAVAWRRLESVPDGDEGRQWLYGVAFRVVARHWRGAGRFGRLLARLGAGRPSTDGPEPQIVRRAEYDLVLEAARRLSATDREILRLAAWEELRHAQIAQLLGMSEEAVRQRFHRARKRLAQGYVKLGGLLDGEPTTEPGGDR